MNQLQPREQEARAIIGSKMNQLNALLGGNKAKASAFASAIANLANDTNLIRCSIDSIVNCAMQIVQIGLNPNKLLGQAYVVAYGNGAQLQIGYKGLIALGYKNGWKFRAVLIYACDEFSIEFGGICDKIKLIPNYDAQNSSDNAWLEANLKGAVVFAMDKDGVEFSEFVSVSKLKKLRASAKTSGVWGTWGEEMYRAKALKYVLSRLPITETILEALSQENSEPIATIPQPKADIFTKQIPTPQAQALTDIKDEPIIDAQPLSQDLIDNLCERGVYEFTAKAHVKTLSEQSINEILSSPQSLDALAQELKE